MHGQTQMKDIWNSKSSVAVACFLHGRAKDLPAPPVLYRRMDGRNSQYERGVKETNLFPLLGINFLFTGRPFRSLATTLNELF
jgi:hypothetical protein